MRRVALLMTTGTKSRLTVTPTRVTVKISEQQIDMLPVFSRAAEKIERHIDLDRTMRGVFDMKLQRVEMSTDHRRADRVVMTFDFEGNLIDR